MIISYWKNTVENTVPETFLLFIEYELPRATSGNPTNRIEKKIHFLLGSLYYADNYFMRRYLNQSFKVIYLQSGVINKGGCSYGSHYLREAKCSAEAVWIKYNDSAKSLKPL